MLDVAFSEDASRKREGNSTQNFSILLKIALNILKKDSKAKVGVKSRRFKAAMSNHYLLKMLNLWCVCPVHSIEFVAKPKYYKVGDPIKEIPLLKKFNRTLMI